MTSIKIDVRSVLGGRARGVASAHAEPDRPGADGGWLSENVDHVPIVDGIAVLPNVEPGPTRIYIAIGSYHRDWLVIVPEGDGEISIEDLIGLDYEWDPPAVGKAQQAQRGAEAAEAGAVAARAGAETAASAATSASAAVTTARDQAAGSASSAAASEGAAAVSAAAAGSHRTAAVAAASAAAGSENAAASAATTATTASSEAATAAATATSMAEGFGLSATAAAGAPGSQAQVTVTRDGTEPTYTVAFTVPRGDKGAAGEVSQAALEDAITAVHLALVGQAPETLRSLAALAESLGNDPQFAASVMALIGERAKTVDVTVALAGKAPLASPALTGSPTVNGAAVVVATDARLTDQRTPRGTVQATWNEGTQSTTNFGLTPAELRAATVVAIGATTPGPHTHTIVQITGLQAALDVRPTLAAVQDRPAMFSGPGGPPASIPGAVVGDWWLNESSMEIFKITGV